MRGIQLARLDANLIETSIAEVVISERLCPKRFEEPTVVIKIPMLDCNYYPLINDVY